MNELSRFALHDLKRVYTVLHANILEHLELLDSDLRTESQRACSIAALQTACPVPAAS